MALVTVFKRQGLSFVLNMVEHHGELKRISSLASGVS